MGVRICDALTFRTRTPIVTRLASQALRHFPHKWGKLTAPDPRRSRYPYTASRTPIVRAPTMPSMAVLVITTTVRRLTGSTNQLEP